MKTGDSVITYMAKTGSENLIKFLIEHNADLKKRTQEGKTALELAALYGNPENIKLLAQKGDEAEKQNALVDAASSGSVTAVEALLGLGISSDARNANAETPLMMAAQGRHKNIINLLKEHGANINATTDKGKTALMYAAEAVPQNKEVIGILLTAGADINKQDATGNTALIYAADHAVNYLSTETLEALVKAGADLKVKNQQGQSALDALKQQITNSQDKTNSASDMNTVIGLLTAK